MKDHERLIRDQFTRQAAGFAAAPSLSAEKQLDFLLDLAAIGPGDTVLDVACGPGIVACAAASRARHVVGLDVTPAMLREAALRQAGLGLSNIEWREGDASSLPFDDGSFAVVLTRFSFHHLVEPAAILDEMTRVCAAGGRVMVVDVTPDAPLRGAFDAMERLRDPSHVRALTRAELEDLGQRAGLKAAASGFYRMETGLDALLARSFPVPGGGAQIRAMIESDIRAGSDRLGVAAKHAEGGVLIGFPVSVLVWKK
jgi:ubiquinone/menaquinone biosynthesis C-methylase UbiE